MRNNSREKVFETITIIKDNLIAFWKEKNNHFVDKNAMSEPGFISTAMGSISLLLIMATFGKSEKIFKDTDFSLIEEIVTASVDEIFKTVNNEGYTAAPFIDFERSEELFNTKRGYIDSISWVVSFCALARFNEKKQYLTFSSATTDKILNLYVSSLKLILDSQHDDGTWGFLTDKECEKSFYFTYSANSCLSDVFDYTLGEIKEIEKKNNDCTYSADENTINYLKENGIPDLIERLNFSRKKISSWILQNVIGVLPQIADCRDLDESTAKNLGIWRQSTKEKFGVNYYYLYYTYYIIDSILQSGTDLLYAEIIAENSSEFSQLKEIYKKQLSESDYYYYFQSSNHSANFISDYIEQATHLSRYHLSSAMRTGVRFWDIKASELEIIWQHNDPEIEQITRKIADNSSHLTDPVLVPMALRANAQFTYFISKQTDLALEKLFHEILENRSDKDSKNCIANMWDGLSYNLAITERSIEAIIDYYDYLCSYENNLQIEIVSEKTVTEEKVKYKSDLELLLENKISEIIDQKLGEKIVPQTSSSFNNANILEIIPFLSRLFQALTQEVSSHGLILNNSMSDEIDQMVYSLSMLYSTLKKYSEQADIANCCLTNDNSIPKEELIQKTGSLQASFELQKQMLLSRILRDISNDDNSCDFEGLYTKLKMLKYRP